MMYKKIYLTVLCNFFVAVAMFSQNYERDSVWVAGIISQGGEYRLNDETLKAIREGTLLNRDMFRDEMQMYSPDLFHNETLIKDSLSYGLNLLHLSPTEYMFYKYKPDSIMIVRSALLSAPDNILVNQYFSIPIWQLDSPEPYIIDLDMVEGELREFIRAKPIITFSLEEGLEDIFRPEERHKDKNRKDADAWKYYNMQEMD